MNKPISKENLQQYDKDTLIDLFMEYQESTAKQLDFLMEQVALLNQRTYGKTSEKGLSQDMMDNQLYIDFNELEFTLKEAGDAFPEEEERIEVPAHTRARKKGVRKEDLNGLERKIITHDASEEEKASLGDSIRELPDEVYDKLRYVPATCFVEEHHVKVYAGSDDRFAKGERPKDAFPGSIATPELVAGIFNAKYVNGTPIARVEKEFERLDVVLRRQTVCRWLDRTSSQYISPLFEALRKALMGLHVVQADETPVQVNKAHMKSTDGEETIGKKKCYMWVYKSGIHEEKKIILYDYRNGRKGE